MNSKIEKKILVTIVLIVLFYVLFAIYSDLEKTSFNFLKIDAVNLMLIFSLMILAMFVRSLIQKLFLDNIGIQLSFLENFKIFISGLSMIITPLGAGQLIKSHFIKQKFGYDISKSAPIVFAERFHDLLAISIIISISLFFYYSVASLSIIIITFSFLIIFFLMLRTRKIWNVLNWLQTKFSFVRKNLNLSSNFENSFLQIFSLNLVVKANLMTLGATIIEGIVVYIGFSMFEIDFNYFQSIQIYYTSVLVEALSLIQGGVGITEGSFVNLLLTHGIELSLATSLVIFVRLSVIWFSTISGFIVSNSYLHKQK